MKDIIQGIYKIENKNTHKVYIGQSKDIYERWRQHKHLLENGNHHAYKLQKYYNLAKDKSVFEYSILEEVKHKEDLTDREQYYMDKYNSVYDGYNSVNTYSTIDPIKYKKNQLKKKKQRYYYTLFAELYLPDIIQIGKGTVWIERLMNQNEMHYSDVTMRRMCIILKWFYDNYDIYDGYRMKILANRTNHNIYDVIIIKKDEYIERYDFNTDKTFRLYRPVIDWSGMYSGINEEIQLSYKDCLKKWKPIDQLKITN